MSFTIFFFLCQFILTSSIQWEIQKLLIDRVPNLSFVHLWDLYILQVNKASSIHSVHV